MGRKERRRHQRRAKSVRFRFQAHGDEYRSVTTGLSRSGAFVKSAYVPRPGQVLTLHEVYTRGGPQLSLRAEVVWTIDEPTLQRPFTGFGLRFLELVTRDDPSSIEEFLHFLDPTLEHRPQIHFEERAEGAVAVLSFTEYLAGTAARPVTKDLIGEADDLPQLDLSIELERLARRDPRQNSGHSSGRNSGRAAASAPSLPALADDGSAPQIEVQAPPPPPVRRPRSRKRSVTGVFTALFTRSKRDEDRLFDASQPANATPALATSPAPDPASDAVRPRMQISWGAGSTSASILMLSSAMVHLSCPEAGPMQGETVTLSPLIDNHGLRQLKIHGMITERRLEGRGRGSTFSVSFSRIDEQGRAGRFKDYLRIIKGPAR